MTNPVLKDILFRKFNMDVTLRVVGDDREIKAHRLILSAASKYFETLFSSEFEEKKSDTITVTVINFETLEMIVTFFYTEEFAFSENFTLAKAMVAADFLMADHATRKLNDCVKENVTKENVIQLYCAPVKFREDNIVFLEKLIVDNIATLEDLPTLNNQQFLSILKSASYTRYSSLVKKLPVAIKKWVMFEPEKRYTFTFELLSAVKFMEYRTASFITKEIIPICKCEKSLTLMVNLLAKKCEYLEVDLYEDRSTSPWEIKAHRLILSATSKYFETLFSSDFKEKILETFTISEMNFETLDMIVTFFYTEEIQFSDKCSLAKAMLAADYLLADRATEALSDTLEENVTKANALELYSSGVKMNEDASVFLEEFIFKHIGELEDLMTVNHEHLLGIMKKGHWTSHSIHRILPSIIKWINFEPEKRCQYTFELLSALKFMDTVNVAYIMTQVMPICKCQESLTVVIAILAHRCQYKGPLVDKYMKHESDSEQEIET